MTTCDVTSFLEKKCQACEGGVPPMEESQVMETLKSFNGWEYKKGFLSKTYKFKDHYKVMAFVNALTWVSHTEDHHPYLKIGYNDCSVNYKTVAIGGISENDFICAAKVDQLV